MDFNKEHKLEHRSRLLWVCKQTIMLPLKAWTFYSDCSDAWQLDVRVCALEITTTQISSKVLSTYSLATITQ